MLILLVFEYSELYTSSLAVNKQIIRQGHIRKEVTLAIKVSSKDIYLMNVISSIKLYHALFGDNMR